MIPRRVSSEDAILVYLIAIAYLNETEITGNEEARAWRAKEMWAGVFYVWPRVPNAEQAGPVPTAICTYKGTQLQWEVAVHSGERLTLYDNGHIWDIVENEEKLSATKKAKRYRRCGRKKW